MSGLDGKIRADFMRASTATITLQLHKRGFRNTWIVGVKPISRKLTRFCGIAYTLRYIPAREDLSRPEAYADRSYPQRRAIEDVPAGHVLVADARRDMTAAVGGDILMARLKARGVEAFVSDGCLRDTPEIEAMEFAVYCAGAAPPASLKAHHAVDTQVPIACGGVPIFPGDILVGDGEGVAVVPRHVAAEVARDAAEQERLEKFLRMRIDRGAPLFGTYPPDETTLAAYRDWLAKGEPQI
jgi:regulator of RNase E activity RraA